MQVYVHHECSAEDLGPSLFSQRDVIAIAMHDIRTVNQDRHVGNILVQRLPADDAKHAALNDAPARALQKNESPAASPQLSAARYSADDCLYPIRSDEMGPTPPSMYGFAKLHSPPTGAPLYSSSSTSASSGNTSPSISAALAASSSGSGSSQSAVELTQPQSSGDAAKVWADGVTGCDASGLGRHSQVGPSRCTRLSRWHAGMGASHCDLIVRVAYWTYVTLLPDTLSVCPDCGVIAAHRLCFAR